MAVSIITPPTNVGNPPTLVYTFSASSNAFASVENVVSTGEATSSASYTDLATSGPAVTITVPASGAVRVDLFALIGLPGGASGGGRMSVALSGANTVAASDANSAWQFPNGGGGQAASQPGGWWSQLFTGLTPGSTTFTAKYKSPGGDSNSFASRRLTVYPVGADQG